MNNKNNNKEEKIVIFSTWNSEYLPFVLEELYKKDMSITAIILDGIIREKDMNIQKERMSSFFEWPDFFGIEKYNIPIYLVKNHNSKHCQELVEKLDTSIIINSGTPRILKPEILNTPKRGAISTHPGILPEYRGCTCVEWALYNNDPVGATCHFMGEGIDDGPMICTDTLEITKGDVYEKVRTNIMFLQAKTMASGLEKVIKEDLSINKMPKQPDGNYYKVIPEDKLNIAKKMLLEEKYSHYKE